MHERVDKASDETINKTYAEYKQRKLNEKREKAGKALGKHVINLYSTRISRLIKIKNVKKLPQDIQNNSIIQPFGLAWAVFSCVRLVIFLRLF